MGKPAPIVSARSPLHEALAMMIYQGIRHLAVVDDKGRCVGVLSSRAASTGWVLGGSTTSRRNVASALDAQPAIIPTRSVVSQAAQLMRTTGVDAIAVADPEGHPVGIVTAANLVALLTGHTHDNERG